jgi:4-hydroxyacetophenone monooxygenase
METTVDSTFIRRAVEVADLNAVRVALYQQTGDPELAQLPTTVNLDEAQRELLISKAVAWLEHNAGPARVAEPEEAELRTLLNMATAEEMGDLEFAARRDLPAFKDFPWTAEWTDGKPELPEGFKVAIIGSGFSGLAMGVQLERLGIPYVLLERRGEPGGVWDHQSLPRCPRRHHFHHL